MSILHYILAYLGIGLLFLLLFDLITGRIRKRILGASLDTQQKLVVSGTYVNIKVAIILTFLAMWLFYPIVLYGALTSSGDKR